MSTAMTTIPLDATPEQMGPVVEFVTIGTSLAEEWLGKNIGNRNLKPLKIETYVRDILDGNWMITGESIKFDWNGRLIDGQNRLTAIIRAGRPVTAVVVRGLDPAVQKVLDTGAKRSAGDSLRMGGHKQSPNVLAASIRLVIAMDRGKLKNASSVAPDVTHAETVDWFKKNPDIEGSVIRATRIAGKIGATPSPLAAAMYLTDRVAPVESYQFYQDLYDLNLRGVGDPRATLLKRLASLREERRLASQQMYYILRSWNAHRAGKDLHGLKDRVQGTPTTIPEPK